ncbi:MAG: hypothetical protein H8E34_09200 [Bacteroidetes bacterium]|nr:hypothetical protein [Bacteroidota bacterium]MBL6943954.1 hypothetical protein [Bacteroidales bacterium]
MILTLLKRLTKEFDFHNISYMLSGSVAMGIYTVPRMTLDIDIVIELDNSNIDVFLNIFKENFYINAASVKEEIKRRGMFNVIDHDTGYKVDFIVRKESKYRRLEFARKRKANINDFSVWVVSPEDLVISKIEWIQQYPSPKQINDIENILDYEDIDKTYIIEWCNELGLVTFNLL